MNKNQLALAPLTLLLLLVCAMSGSAQEQPGNVGARVNGQLVHRLEVEHVLREAFRGRPLADEARPHAEAAALDQAINRRLVLDWLQSQQIAATDEQVQTAYDEFLKNLEFQQTDVAAFLEREKLTEESLRRSITWDIAWGRYMRQQLTVTAREEYFAENSRQFDGTQIRTSHILLGDSATDLDARIAQAQELKGRLETGSLSFADAVEQFSTGSKQNGGDLGFVERHGSMPAAFNEATFQLQAGEISEPVVTPFGVHLITATEIKPGKKELKDVVREVDQAMTQEILAGLVHKLRQDAKIEYTGGMPYFDPDSGELVNAAR